MKFWAKKMGPKNLVQKINVVSKKKFWVKKNLWSRNFRSEKMLSKNLGKKLRSQKIISPKKCCVQKLSPAKNGVQKLGSKSGQLAFVKDCPWSLPLKFGKNQVSNS